MKFINEINEEELVVGHYLCKKKESLTSKTNKQYLSLKLADKTGEIDGKVWEPQVNIGEFEAGDFVKIEARSALYQQALQLKVVRLRRSRPDEYELGDYIAETPRDRDEMKGELLGIIDTVKNPYINALLKSVIIDDPYISSKLDSHTAAKSLHHNYLGGLLEHTLSVTRLADFCASHYKEAVNRDVLVACAMLHDIGKIYELSELPAADYTDDGELLGHIVIMSEIIGRKCDNIPGFPGQLKSIIRHVILAHHGQYEFGSPKLPKTIEALILNACDNLDAKAFAFADAVAKRKPGSPWAGYSRMFEGNIRATDFDES